jgi:hypothetical protein
MIKSQDTFTPLPEGIQKGECVEGQEVGSIGSEFYRRSPKPIEGFQLFSLGSLYVHANVDRDLVAEFQRESAEFEVLNLEYQTPVFYGLAEWDYILQAMPVEIFKSFQQFLGQYLLINTPLKEFFEIRGYWCPFPNIISTESIAVFTPSGNAFKVTALLRPGLVEIVKDRPDKAVVDKAKMYFKLDLN